MLDTKLKKSHKLTNLIIALVVLLPALLLVCLYPKMEEAAYAKKAQWEQEWEERQKEYEEQYAGNKVEETVETPEDEEASEGTEAVDGAEITEHAAATENMSATENEAATENAERTDTPSEPETVEASDTEDINSEYFIHDNFVNYAVEACYYEYAMMLQDALGAEVYTGVLEEYGWINDYYELSASTPYYVQYRHDPENIYEKTNQQPISEEEIQQLMETKSLGETSDIQLSANGLLGFFYLEFDAYGKISDIRMEVAKGVEYNSRLYEKAKGSVAQYENNVLYFEEQAENDLDYRQACPKNFRAVFFLYDNNSRFVESYEKAVQDYYGFYKPYHEPYEFYFATGAYWIVLALAVFVALAALILPFFKKLETGWEKLFCMPLEVIVVLIGIGISGAMGMGIFMSYSTMESVTHELLVDGNQIELLGYVFSPEQCYGGLLVLNFLGWAACFFTEYICVAQLRQFFCGPKYYIKHRLLGVVFLRWIWRQCKKLYKYVTDIDIHENLHKSILKIVLVNFGIVTLLCCLWFAGVFGVIVYSVVLYILLRKFGNKLQKQYQSILSATGQMAEGDLHITLEEDLGVFAPLGKELEGVQQGFSKAVAEEAKSQNMKSELITNVSHDLKTPLTAIITYVDLLKNPEITEEERKSYIETLELKSQRLKVLIEDLFEVSKANSGNVKMNFMDVDIVKLMKEVRVEMSDKIENSNLDFRWNLPEEKIILNLDGQRTYRIFENLLNNAIKYAMPFTRVYVDMIQKDSEVVITFKNMSAQELNFDAEHLTERFVRGDSSRNSEGSGLGLAIAKSFTELQHGEFHISIDGDLFKVSIRFLKK